MSSSATAPIDNRPKQYSFIGKRIRGISALIAWLFFAFVFSVLIEWIGIALSFWELPNDLHAKAMLNQELEWLHEDFHGVLGSPAETSLRFSRAVYDFFFVFLGKDWGQTLVLWMTSSDGERDYSAFISAALIMFQLFFVRLTILFFSLPVFIVFSLVAVVDGLVVRDIRRFTLDREQAWIWHSAAAWVKPLFIAPFIIYLTCPFSLHPNWVILPFAILLSFVLWLVTSKFKKYA